MIDPRSWVLLGMVLGTGYLVFVGALSFSLFGVMHNMHNAQRHEEPQLIDIVAMAANTSFAWRGKLILFLCVYSSNLSEAKAVHSSEFVLAGIMISQEEVISTLNSSKATSFHA